MKITTPPMKNKIYEFELQGEFKMIRPPIFDGKTEEGGEGWLLNITKYFQVCNYGRNLKAR